MKRIAIIPARGGSKRIPRKNIKLFLGKPIIAYSIEMALNSGLFDTVMVSTDDDEIRKVSLAYGAVVPFLRSTEKSNDYATLADVLKEVLDMYLANGENYDYFCCILPTAPFIDVLKLKEASSKLEKCNYDAVFPIVRFSYPIQRALISENDKIKLMYPKYEESRSQDLKVTYHDAGQFYWANTKRFLLQDTLFTNNTGMVELAEMQVQDIDTEEDWRVAEFKYKMFRK